MNQTRDEYINAGTTAGARRMRAVVYDSIQHGAEVVAEQASEPYYDYEAQLWVQDGIVQPCSHPESMRSEFYHCCAADRYKGCSIKGVLEVLRLAASAE